MTTVAVLMCMDLPECYLHTQTGVELVPFYKADGYALRPSPSKTASTTQ